jgi:CheY-like chemotaxis protein
VTGARLQVVSGGIPTVQRPKILLIEDSQSDAYLVRVALEQTSLKADLTHFAESEKAVAWLAKLEKDAVPSLLILDLNIPRKDGFEVLSAVRSNPALAEMPILVLTSSISPEDRRRAAAGGVRRFVSKPMMLDDFLQAVGAAVESTIAETTGGSVSESV